MCKQKSEWYDEFENEIIMFECHECGHIEEADEEYMECPECESEDFHMETSTAGMECGICNSYLPTEEGEISYSSMFDRKSDGKAHQYICVDCYNQLVEQEEELQEEIREMLEEDNSEEETDVQNLVTTLDGMKNVYKEEIQYFVNRYYPEHEERAHNDRWIEPAKWSVVQVSKDEYDNYDKRTYKQNQYAVKRAKVHVPFKDFVEYWTNEYLNSLNAFERNKSLENVDRAIFALKQYFYIVKLTKDYPTQIVKVAEKMREAELESIEEMVKDLEKKRKPIKTRHDKAEEKKKERQAELKEILRQEEIAELEAKLKKLKGE